MSTWNLCLIALSLGVGHTLIGVDHYLPLISFSKAAQWSLRKTAVWSLLCGLTHVGSSIFLGIIGLWAGLAAVSLEGFEGLRGTASGFAFLGLGIALFVWGLRTMNRPDVETPSSAPLSNVCWWIFLIFILGPCEPLIPLLIYPAAAISFWSAAVVTVVFCAATLVTMISAVLLGRFAVTHVPAVAASWSRLAVGSVCFLCGAYVLLGG